METLRITTNGRIRRATLNGRRFIVANAVILKGGAVLNGSKGPLLYPSSECARNPGIWNGVRLVQNHPVQNGLNVSARSPEVLEEYELGQVFNDHWNSVSETRNVECWFDEDLTSNKAGSIYRDLLNGKPIELSTGLETKNHPVANGLAATKKGDLYTHVARDYLPDHLAILPEARGACSVKDGCGVNNELTENVWSQQAREAALMARRASKRADKTQAVFDHMKAKRFHEKAGVLYRKHGDENKAQHHYDQAASHGLTAQIDRKAEKKLLGNTWSDAARRAAQAARKAGLHSGDAKGMSLSKKANKLSISTKGKKGIDAHVSHLKAATAHTTAGNYHRSITPDGGDDKTSESHYSAAMAHQQAAKNVKMKRSSLLENAKDRLGHGSEKRHFVGRKAHDALIDKTPKYMEKGGWQKLKKKWSLGGVEVRGKEEHILELRDNLKTHAPNDQHFEVKDPGVANTHRSILQKLSDWLTRNMKDAKGHGSNKKGLSLSSYTAVPGDRVQVPKTATTRKNGSTIPHRYAGRFGTVVQHDKKYGSVHVKLDNGSHVRLDHINVTHNTKDPKGHGSNKRGSSYTKFNHETQSFESAPLGKPKRGNYNDSTLFHKRSEARLHARKHGGKIVNDPSGGYVVKLRGTKGMLTGKQYLSHTKFPVANAKDAKGHGSEKKGNSYHPSGEHNGKKYHETWVWQSPSGAHKVMGTPVGGEVDSTHGTIKPKTIKKFVTRKEAKQFHAKIATPGTGQYDPTTNQDQTSDLNLQGDDEMNRGQLIQFLTTNCECLKGKAKLLANEENFTNEELLKMKKNHDKNVQNELVINKMKKKECDDEMDESVTNEEDDDLSDRPLTERLTPAELRVYNTAARVEKRERRALTNQLKLIAANSPKDKKQLITNKLAKNLDIEQLEELLVAVRPSRTVNQSETDTELDDDEVLNVDYGVGNFTGNRHYEEKLIEDDTPLGTTTMNEGSEKKQKVNADD